MRIYFDTEFTGLHQNTTLISIGLVSEDNQTFYAEFSDYDVSQVDDWIRENVLKHLLFSVQFSYRNTVKDVAMRATTRVIVPHLLEYLQRFDHVQMWSDCLSYDWVLFRELFNNNLPPNVSYIPMDLCTLLEIKGIDPDINREMLAGIEGTKHNALHDAKVIKACVETVAQLHLR